MCQYLAFSSDYGVESAAMTNGFKIQPVIPCGETGLLRLSCSGFSKQFFLVGTESLFRQAARHMALALTLPALTDVENGDAPVLGMPPADHTMAYASAFSCAIDNRTNRIQAKSRLV